MHTIITDPTMCTWNINNIYTCESHDEFQCYKHLVPTELANIRYYYFVLPYPNPYDHCPKPILCPVGVHDVCWNYELFCQRSKKIIIENNMIYFYLNSKIVVFSFFLNTINLFYCKNFRQFEVPEFSFYE